MFVFFGKTYAKASPPKTQNLGMQVVWAFSNAWELSKSSRKTHEGSRIILQAKKKMLDVPKIITPPPKKKTNMSPENQCLEDGFPIETVPFLGTCSNLGGCKAPKCRRLSQQKRFLSRGVWGERSVRLECAWLCFWWLLCVWRLSRKW